MAKFIVNSHHAYLNNEIVIKAEGLVTIEDTLTGQIYEFVDEMRTHLSAGHHVLKSNDHREDIVIEDAIKLGGSQIKNAFVFDDNPWCFVATKDRLYITNSETHEEKVEYNVTPDEIICLPAYGYPKDNEYFLFKTHFDYAIYNVLTGRIVFQFTNHIFSNEHLVIFKKENGVEVYDFREDKVVVYFEGQYSFGYNKFFFVSDKQLCGLNLNSSYINTISYVGNVRESDMLLGNNLLRLNEDYSNKKVYSYFSLGNGEKTNSMSETKIISPYFIASWEGEETPHFSKTKEDYTKFKEECGPIGSSYHNLHTMCLGINITGTGGHWNAGRYIIKIHGEIMSYPAMRITIPFFVEGNRGETIDIMDYSFEIPQKQKGEKSSEAPNVSFALEKEERKIGESKSGNLIITQSEGYIYLRELSNDTKQRILQDSFDKSHYASAYFTSDGNNVLLRVSNTEAQLFGFSKLSTEPFEVEGFTLARNEGYNGYKPEVSILDGRKPVWRDPITLDLISEKEMSNHIFRSPDGKYIADTQMKTVIYNRLTKSEINLNDLNDLKVKYNWNTNTTKEEKEAIIERRKSLAKRSNRYDLFGKIIDLYNRSFSQIEDEKEREEKRNKVIENNIECYLTKESDFVSLIVDKLGYVCYHKNDDGAEEKRVLIGRNVYFLNYVSFSYDSNYLSFAAKMREDDFRFSQEGVFEIYDLENEEVVNRTERFGNHQLWAVWMSMFSKTGDVAFYDSYANAYLVRKSGKYNITEEAPGKSLLCFSPSGRYIACSDQNYIDYTHHPNENWGHQPSGNVFIHSIDNFGECLEQYNDMGDGVSGVAMGAGNVSSAAFSQDETKLLMVGNDGVVVVRNLKMTNLDNDEFNDDCVDYSEDYGTHYGEFAGTYAQDVVGYSDDEIYDAFDGEPDAYWNID